MEGMLLVSRKTYSLAKKKAVTEWIEKPFEITGLREPHDFELRFVNANLNMENLEDKFAELRLSWSQSSDIKDEAYKMLSVDNGLTDIVWYSDKLKVALVVESHTVMSRILNATSIDKLKEMLG